MARRDPLMPNAGIVARREYRDRTRSPLFIASTFMLMGIALLVTLAPIGIRYIDSQTITRIAVVADDDGLALGAIGVTDSLLNIKPDGVDEATWKRPFVIERATDAESATDDMARGKVAGIMTVGRLPSGQIDVVYTTSTLGDTARNQMVGFAAVGDRHHRLDVLAARGLEHRRLPTADRSASRGRTSRPKAAWPSRPRR